MIDGLRRVGAGMVILPYLHQVYINPAQEVIHGNYTDNSWLDK